MVLVADKKSFKGTWQKKSNQMLMNELTLYTIYV